MEKKMSKKRKQMQSQEITTSTSSSKTPEKILNLEENDEPLGKLTRKEYNLKKKSDNKMWLLSNKIGIELNLRYKGYYQLQLPVLLEEWEDFHRVMTTPLPVTFRLSTSTRPFTSLGIRYQLEMFQKSKTRFIEMKGEVIRELIAPVRCFANCTSSIEAYQINVDSSTLAKNESCSDLSRFILRESAWGNVVRQELVSMIPALALDIRSHHLVLDMCAAPGSKTEQLLSLLHATCPTDDVFPTGMVVANDPDSKRIETLKKRYAQSGSPNLLITCATAAELADHIKTHAPSRRVFDRIVCDVPCTGDGTFRKFPHQWRLFRPRYGVEIHELQLEIALSAASLLKVGGRMVYSTCSLNPLENESVVASLLQTYGGALELVDVQQEGIFPNLKSRQGLSTWRCDTDILVQSEESEEERLKTLSKLPAIKESMLPPQVERAKALHLERCMRILPHDQNTGGFFIAALVLVRSPALELSDKTKKKKKLLSKDASLHLLRELGFNPKQDNSKAEVTATGEASQSQGSANNSQSIYSVRRSNDGGFSVVSRKGSVSQACTSLGFVSELGLEALFEPSPASPVLLGYSIASKSRGAKPAPNFAITASSKAESRAKPSQSVEPVAIAAPTLGLTLVSCAVHSAISIWADESLVVQAGVSVFTATGTPAKDVGMTRFGVTGLEWAVDPNSAWHLTHLLSNKAEVPSDEFFELLELVVSMATSDPGAAVVLPPDMTSTISEHLFDFVSNSEYGWYVLVPAANESDTAAAYPAGEGSKEPKRRMSKAQRRSIKKGTQSSVVQDMTKGSLYTTSEVTLSQVLRHPRSELCLVFAKSEEGLVLLTPIDACQSFHSAYNAIAQN